MSLEIKYVLMIANQTPKFYFEDELELATASYQQALTTHKNCSLKELSSVKVPQLEKNCLGKAQEVIYGDREKTYGTPAKNLNKIAALWNAYLDSSLTANDVCNMMVLLKTARLQNSPGHEDSLVDICGYTALQQRILVAAK